MSAEVLKALANPLRRRILNALSVLRSGRAADLAQRLEVPANKLSFHLRVLADAGLIREDATLARDRRDRVWVTVSGSRAIGSPEDPVADPALGQAVLAGVVSDQVEVLRRISGWVPAYVTGEDPEVRGALTNYTLRLSRERFSEMVDEIDKVVGRFKTDPHSDESLGWNFVVMGASEEI
jgi:DNA-binding transcriptional ArsR family regulator